MMLADKFQVIRCMRTDFNPSEIASMGIPFSINYPAFVFRLTQCKSHLT